MRLLAPFAVIVLALAAVLWVDETPPDADFVFVNQNEVFTLDPQRMSYMQDLRLAYLLYEGLVRWDNRDFTILPAASALPEVSPDGRTYTFRLRDDAVWATGDPVTAHDFVFTWRRAMLPDTAADYTNLFFLIDGAESFFQWRTAQTTSFAADPFANGDPTTTQVHGLVQRLTRLLDQAGELPDVLAGPSDADTVRRELESLTRAAEMERDLHSTLDAAKTVRAWHEALERTRDAEAEWMWADAEARFDDMVHLRALDANTLEVRLRRATPYFLDLAAFGVFAPVHRPTVEGWLEVPAGGWASVTPPPIAERRWLRVSSRSGRLEQKHDWTKPRHHVGNGPYRLEQWRYKRDLRLERSATYHALDRVGPESILAITIEDTNTAVLAFETGHIDWLADVATGYEPDMLEQRQRYVDRYASELAALEAKGVDEELALASMPPPERGERRNIHIFPTFGTEFFNFNCRETLADGRTNPFADAAVRRAFTLSVDKQTIVDRVTRLREPVITTLIPPDSIEGYESPVGLPYDPDRARQELEDAGWKDRNQDGRLENDQNEEFPVVDLLYTTNLPRYKWISLELKSQWEQKLGIEVELRPSETKFYKEDLKRGNFMIARGRWYGDYGDPTTFLELCRSTDGNNDRKYSNPDVDQALDDAERELDPEKRLQMLSEIEAFLFQEEVPMLIICQLTQVYMYEPGKVRGLSTHPRLTQYLWKVDVREDDEDPLDTATNSEPDA